MRARVLAVVAVVLVAMAFPTGAHAGFGFIPGSISVNAENRDGTIDTQAGSHPFAFNLSFALRTEGSGLTEGGAMRDVLIDLPPGMFANPQSVPVCPREDFEGGVPNCSPDTQVGVLRAILATSGEVFGPIYNLAPPPGVALQMGFSGAELVAQLSGSVSGAAGYGARVASLNAPIEVTAASATIWGNPADPSHDAERGQLATEGRGGPVASHAPLLPFFTMPTICAGPPEVTLSADSRLSPGNFVTESVLMRGEGGIAQALTGCGAVPFSPSIKATPTSASAESAAGLAFQLSLPDQGLLNSKESAVTETQPIKTEVVLPVGVTANPSAAAGLIGCSPGQIGLVTAIDQVPARFDETTNGCPPGSKLGTLVANSPLLSEPIEGSIYLATPQNNPFRSLVALYIVASAPQRGVVVKQAGRVDIDPVSGQLTTTFDGLPPLPYSSFEVRLREGPRAPLITPQACGEYRTVARLYPFSTPSSAVERTVPFKITSGAESAACASSEVGLPVHPGFEAGASVPLAASYSPFVFRVSRADGEQRFSSVSATLPTGLLGKLKGIPYCSDAGIAAASARTMEGDGALEIASPSCPAASKVGIVNVTAGAGASPIAVQGSVYLAGPYKGAPLSLEIVTPAIAGPFDLGAVAIRTALHVNPLSAQIQAVSDPLPSSLHGIPLDVRSISLQMDRPEFTINPTNCRPQSVLSTLSTIGGATTNLSNRFAVGGCKGLDFKPTLKLFFTGQTKRTGYPAVKAVLTQPAGENANVATTSVILPKGMLIANAHINNPCTRVQFNSTPVPGEGCPPKSVLGTAKAWSPLLENPEEGKVYFRSNGGERQLPDLVVALRGQVPLQLVGFIDSVGKKGAEVRRVRNRFMSVPDAPVSRFELKLAGGKKGLLQNSKNLCGAGGKANFKLTGQNGKTFDTEPKVQVSCGGRKKP